MTWHIKIPGNDTDEIANALAALARAKGSTIGKITKELIINHLTQEIDVIMASNSFFAKSVPTTEHIAN